MAEYQYDPDKKNKSDGDGLYWIIALGLIITGIAAPIGVLMIVLKVLSGGKKSKRGVHPADVQRQQSDAQGSVGARTTAPPAQYVRVDANARPLGRDQKGKHTNDPLRSLTERGQTLTLIGSILSAVFAFVILAGFSDAASYLISGSFSEFVQEAVDVLPIFCFLGGGLGCLWAGLRSRKKARRCRNYLAMIGRQQSVSVSALASATGVSPARVRDDLQNMLADGVFPAGYLDYGGDRLILSGDGLHDEATEQPAPKPPAEGEENAVLSEIHAVNDAITNKKLSAQIDRIGIITAKIFDYQKSHPDKSPQLHSFLSYYLPTTLKILRAYAQLEAQEVAGANITAAMERIEGMMDKVVEGFEKQLDQLFQGDAMDITTDVEVLERMLAKDGLSDPGGMQLGI